MQYSPIFQTKTEQARKISEFLQHIGEGEIQFFSSCYMLEIGGKTVKMLKLLLVASSQTVKLVIYKRNSTLWRHLAATIARMYERNY